jgi:hypothetical protein
MLFTKFWFNWQSGFYGNLHHNQFITSFSWKFIKFPSFCIKSYGSLIYSYLCNQCISPLALWFRIPLRRGVLDTTLCDKVCQWLAAGCSFSLGTKPYRISCRDLINIFLMWYVTKIIVWILEYTSNYQSKLPRVQTKPRRIKAKL